MPCLHKGRAVRRRGSLGQCNCSPANKTQGTRQEVTTQHTSSASSSAPHAPHTTSTTIKHHINKTHRNGKHRAVVVVAPSDHLDGTLAELDGRAEERHRADGRGRDQGRGVLPAGLARSEEEEEGREEDEGYEEGQGKAGALARQSFEEGRHGWRLFTSTFATLPLEPLETMTWLALQQLSDTECFLRGINRTRSTESTANHPTMRRGPGETIAQTTTTRETTIWANFSLPPREAVARRARNSNRFSKNQASKSKPAKQPRTRFGKFESASALLVHLLWRYR